MYFYKKEQFFTDDNIIVLRKNKSKSFDEPAHTHDFIEIVYIISGECNHVIDDKSYPVSGGSLLFINYGQTHAFRVDSSMEYIDILLKPEAVSEKIINTNNAFEILSLTAFEDFRTADVSCPFVSFDGEDRRRVEHIINEMYYEQSKNHSGRDTVLKGYLSVLLAYIFRRMLPVDGEHDNIMEDIIKYIESNLDKKLTLEHLATKCFYSPKYFSKAFKECSGITVTEYIQKKRIDEGCRLLAQTNLPIEDICSAVGYADDVRFYKYFKKYCGITPREYRKKMKNGMTL